MTFAKKNTYTRTIEELFSLQKFGIKLGLGATRNLLKKLGRPDQNMKFVHLAGSNGKGSVGATLSSILSQAGYKVGFYTSPHLVTFRERFLINDKMISRKKVVELAKRVSRVANTDPPQTFFEVVTAMAFCYFADEKVDLVILETGLGGRLDATNVIKPMAGVITNISLEHTEYLGNTLAEIAGEKAGIIKRGMTVITGEGRKALRELLRETAERKKAPFKALGQDFKVRANKDGSFNYYGPTLTLKGLKSRLLGPHQAGNSSLALAALEAIDSKGFKVSEDNIRQGLANVSWPGRAEIFTGPPDIMLDGAHNPAAAKVLAGVLTGLDYRKTHMVLGIMEDKDIPAIMSRLLPLASKLYLTRPEYFRATAPENLAKLAEGFPGKSSIHKTVASAIKAAQKSAGKKDLILVTGSLFTVGEARGFLTGESDT